MELRFLQDKKRLAQVKEKIKQSETLLKRMEFQHEVLQQQLTHVTAEREALETAVKRGRLQCFRMAFRTSTRSFSRRSTTCSSGAA